MPARYSRPTPAFRLLAAALLAVACLAPRPLWAQIGSDRYASVVMDAGTGAVLSAVSPDEYRFPASLTKMMTLYMLFEALRDRRLVLQQPVPVSSYAASMSPTKLGLLPGTYITVEQALLALVTKSANDAAAALGELMGGDEERFAQMMTLRARALGMANTTFRNASGLPDWSQVTTARDMAVLGRRLVQDFPMYYRYFSVPSFVFQGRLIMNHQRLLQTYPGADGLKTGYIIASGYNVVTSAVRGETRLIGAVMGASSGWERDQHMASLLDQSFDRMGAVFVARQDAPLFRMPSLISAAQAAVADAPPRMAFQTTSDMPSQAARQVPATQFVAMRDAGRPRQERVASGRRSLAQSSDRRISDKRPVLRVAQREARVERRAAVAPVRAVRATVRVARAPDVSPRSTRAGGPRARTRTANAPAGARAPG